MPASIIPVILSGGSGTRLWPMSRPDRPKQFLALTAEATMLQLTAQRVRGADFAAPMIVANTAHAGVVTDQLAQIEVAPAAIILEPIARNTAPAIALAALAADDPAAPLLVMPSDHAIADPEAFRTAIAAAVPLVRDGWLVTFGITPDAPETGYGYIKVGDALAEGVHRVDRFVEKPARAAAEAMLAGGDHVWNGGIFLFRADTYLEALAANAPEMLAAARLSMEQAARQGVEIRPDADAFGASPSDSIDYAVMEKAAREEHGRVAVVPVSMGWNDVGSWDALHALSACDSDGNSCPDSDAVLIDTTNCLVRSDGARVAMVGVSDLIVIASGNDILILPRGHSQDVKKVVEELKRR